MRSGPHGHGSVPEDKAIFRHLVLFIFLH
jgi:hypothetical protein